MDFDRYENSLAKFTPAGNIPILRYSSHQNMTPSMLHFKRHMTVYFHIPHLRYGIFKCSENNYQGLFLWYTERN